MTKRRARLVLLCVAVGACSGGGLVTYRCDPACPAGSQCGPEGCVVDVTAAAPDLAVADLASSGCDPACTGATPHCDPGGACVACLVDAHCPAGQVCAALGATRLCRPGCTSDDRCGGGSERCCGGACVDTATDSFHCGACATSCAAAHATAACAAGRCAGLSCDAGWGDCNGDATDGCEANLTTETASCGACGHACALPNAESGCAGACFIAACRFGWDDCNDRAADGCELAVSADPRNCGACGVVCQSVPHAGTACEAGLCQLTRCDDGYADCDGSAHNGCETHTLNDPGNCGGCGVACGKGLVCSSGACTCPNCQLAHARSGCINNVCSIVSCLPGFADCDGAAKDGCEVATASDGKNCGACGVVCDKATPVCVKGSCQAGCVYNQAVLASSPIGYWTLDETMGNVAADQAAMPHAGTLLGAPTLGQAGVSGTAWQFHAGNNADQVRIGPVTSGTTSEVSYEFWVWLDALPAQAITVLWDDDAAGGGDSWIEITPAGNFQTHRSPDGFGDFLSIGTVSVAAWTHFVLTIDAGGKSLYLNGVLDSTTNALPGDPRTGRSYVTLCANYDGNFNPGGPHYFDGTLDEVAIYDHSLTADEVGAHFGAACPM